MEARDRDGATGGRPILTHSPDVIHPPQSMVDNGGVWASMAPVGLYLNG